MLLCDIWTLEQRRASEYQDLRVFLPEDDTPAAPSIAIRQTLMTTHRLHTHTDTGTQSHCPHYYPCTIPSPPPHMRDLSHLADCTPWAYSAESNASLFSLQQPLFCSLALTFTARLLPRNEIVGDFQSPFPQWGN